MYGREELYRDKNECGTVVYNASKADKVMEAMEARIKELEEVISKMETTQKWIRVKDRLPEESTFVKVKLESGTKRKMMYAYGNWFDYNEFVWYNDGDKVTHWKPLSPPPTTKEKRK